MPDGAVQRTGIEESDWLLGPPDAPVTILEYGDYECGFCAAVRPVLRSLIDLHQGGVRLVYRHFPITTIHAHAAMAAEAAECAGAQGKFWLMHDMIFNNQPELEYEDLRWCAEAVGVDVLRFDDEMAAHLYRGEVRRDFRRGVQDGVNGTPTIFLNGQRYDGPRDQTSMAAAIAALAGEAGDRGLYPV